MSSFWRIKQDDEQFNTLLNAISSGGVGTWQKVASNITQIPWGTLNCDEILCVVKETLGQKVATAFILPYAEMGKNIPIVDGNYYNANYYYSFAIQSGVTNLYVNPSWCRGYENGTVISGSDFVMDVYVRKAVSNGGSGGSDLSQIYHDVQLGIGLNGNTWETLFTDTISIPQDGYYFVDSSFQKINGFGNGMLSTRILCDNEEMLNGQTENGTRASVSFNSTLNVGVQSNNIVYLTQGNHIFTVQAYSSMGTNPIGFCTFEIYK